MKMILKLEALLNILLLSTILYAVISFGILVDKKIRSIEHFSSDYFVEPDVLQMKYNALADLTIFILPFIPVVIILIIMIGSIKKEKNKIRLLFSQGINNDMSITKDFNNTFKAFCRNTNIIIILMLFFSIIKVVSYIITKIYQYNYADSFEVLYNFSDTLGLYINIIFITILIISLVKIYSINKYYSEQVRGNTTYSSSNCTKEIFNLILSFVIFVLSILFIIFYSFEQMNYLENLKQFAILNIFTSVITSMLVIISSILLFFNFILNKKVKTKDVKINNNFLATKKQLKWCLIINYTITTIYYMIYANHYFDSSSNEFIIIIFIIIASLAIVLFNFFSLFVNEDTHNDIN